MPDVKTVFEARDAMRNAVDELSDYVDDSVLLSEDDIMDSPGNYRKHVTLYRRVKRKLDAIKGELEAFNANA